MTEQWRDVIRFEGLYQVSNMGRVRSLERYTKALDRTVRHHREKIMSIQYHGSMATLVLSGGRVGWKYLKEVVRVDRLVWETFKGVVPVGFKVVCIDGNVRNNALENLELRKILVSAGSY